MSLVSETMELEDWWMELFKESCLKHNWRKMFAIENAIRNMWNQSR